ncbi:MAG: lactonase family protein [Ginsengibacter sp.]
MRLYLLLCFCFFSLTCLSQKFHLFVGTYTGSGSKGIYVCQFDASSGKVTQLGSTDSAVNPSYLALSPDGRYLYSVNETNHGSVSSYFFDPQNATLSFISKQLTDGGSPCYVTVDKTGKWLFAANYGGGSATAFPLEANGQIRPYAQLLQDSGKGFDPRRQSKPHVHSAMLSPDEKYLFTPDLGLDKIMIYKFKPMAQKPLSPGNPAFQTVKPGYGPRHLAFHPNNKYVYLITEMGGAVIAFKYGNGKFTTIQNINAHPEDYSGTPGSADIHVSPDGNYLYASNRGDENNIAIFSIDKNTGKLQLKGYQSTLGKNPRNFVIDPTGNYLLVANQDTNNIVVFKIDKGSGMLEKTGDEIEIPKPVCLKMEPVK